MPPCDTKTRILDGAEQLFAREGFHNTSLRALTSLAEANLASVNYHFGSKEALLQAVIERRLLPLNTIRQKKLKKSLPRHKKAPPFLTRKPCCAPLLNPLLNSAIPVREPGILSL